MARDPGRRSRAWCATTTSIAELDWPPKYVWVSARTATDWPTVGLPPRAAEGLFDARGEDAEDDHDDDQPAHEHPPATSDHQLPNAQGGQARLHPGIREDVTPCIRGVAALVQSARIGIA